MILFSNNVCGEYSLLLGSSDFSSFTHKRVKVAFVSEMDRPFGGQIGSYKAKKE